MAASAAIAQRGVGLLRGTRSALAERSSSSESQSSFEPGKALAAAVLAAVLVLSAASSMMQRAASPLSDAVEAYRADVVAACGDVGLDAKWANLILAMMQQESGGNPNVGSVLGARGDVMQAAEGAYGWVIREGWPEHGVSAQTPLASIYAGALELKMNLELWEGWLGEIDVADTGKVKLVVQGYNYGAHGWLSWCKANGIREWSLEASRTYSRTRMPAGAKGTPDHADRVMRYYAPYGFALASGAVPAGGLAIPLYLQTDPAWGSLAYPYASGRSSTIARSACGPTCFAMVASYLTGSTITPPEVLLGGRYHVSGGTSWSYFGAAAEAFGAGSVMQTGSWSHARAALEAGHPVICSQGPGMFTSSGHFIVLRGITDEGRVLVNDPNDSQAKGYAGREFEAYQVTSTARQYWIFEKRG